MKNKIIILFFFIGFYAYAQNINWDDSILNHNPNPKNELSQYFKKNIKRKLLKKVGFYPKKNNIVLSFNINNENKPYRISVNSFGGLNFSEEVKKAFEKYPLEKLGLKSLDKKNRYHLQIVSKQKKKNIFNCSTTIVVEEPPIIDSCSDLNNYEDLKNCLSFDVKQHFYNNLNFNLLQDLPESKDLKISFKVTRDGKIIDNKSKYPSIFKTEIERVFYSYTKIAKPELVNGKQRISKYSFTIPVEKGETPTYSGINKTIKKHTKPNSEKGLSKFFKERLPKEYIEKANLNRINNSFKIYFELDKSNKPFNIGTNARSSALEEKIIEIFKLYPTERLEFLNKSPYNKYIAQILSFTNNKTIVNASSYITSETYPVFPGCESSESIKKLKKCFSVGIQRHFVKKFDSRLPSKLGLSRGRKSMVIRFKINTKGNIDRIKIKAPHPLLKKEILRVIQLLPKMQPGKQGKNLVSISYALPFSIYID